MTVWTEKAQIVTFIVPVITVDVIDLQNKRTIVPGCLDGAHRVSALQCETSFNHCSAKNRRMLFLTKN
jgi:hypothetical protein